MSDNKKPAGGLLSFLPPPKKQQSQEHTFIKTKQEEEMPKKQEVSTKRPQNSQIKFVSPIYQNSGSSKKTLSEEKLSLPPPKIFKTEIQAKVASLCAYSDESDEDSNEEDCQETKNEPKNYLISDDKDEVTVDKTIVEKPTKTLNENCKQTTQINKNHPRYMQQSIFQSKNNPLSNNNQVESDESENEIIESHEYQQCINESDINEILRRECGKRKRENPDSINIIDINVNQIIEQNKEELLKNMTKEDIKPAKEFKGGKFGAQITYLAQLAKERDQELKAAWAEQKNTRRVSKQRYGF